MIIKKSAIGNTQEAFIQPYFDEKLNIISSDDNNRGKTIEIQSLLYALGNEPVFPTTFDYKKYYHYIEFIEGGTIYHLCRNNDDFVLKHNNTLMFFNGVSELKRYWDNHIFELPHIIKNQIAKIVDPVLFFQIFFVGQDKKDTSNVAQKGYYTKFDFYNMLFDICELSGLELNQEEIDRIKSDIEKLKRQEKALIAKHKILASNDAPVSYLSSINDKDMFSKKVSELDRLKIKIAELRKARNLATTRKLKWEITLKELNSLNRAISCGELKCMDCGSTNITFESSQKGAYSFDVSTHAMRSEIIASINAKLLSYDEEIEKLSMQIGLAQDQLTEIMTDDNITLESIVAYKNQYFDASEAELELKSLRRRIDEYNSLLIQSSKSTQDNNENREKLIVKIVELMNLTYKQIDPTGNLLFEDLFTKKDEVFSGSEATVFHLVKLYSLAKILNHHYPIVVDSFRAEDLSTVKESIVIDLFKQLPNQVIFTTTLKTQELGKYDDVDGIFHIDYKEHLPSKMLTENYVEEFKALLAELSIQIK